MKVSLVINTYNRMHTLPNTLDAIQRLRFPELEVIIVDGPSDDGTEEYIKSNWGDKVKFYKCMNRNLSESRNIGIKYSCGEIVAFTDDDGIPEPNWLDEIIKIYEDPTVGAVGGFVRDNTGISFQAKHIISKRDARSETLIESFDLVPDSKPLNFEFPGLIGVNSSFRRSALIKIGGFDEEYAYFLDETDVIVRLVDAGYKIIVNPKAEVHHKYASSHIRTEKGLPKTWLPTARSIAYYVIKNALPHSSLSSIFDDIYMHKKGMAATTNWAINEGYISVEEGQNLLNTLNDGINEGIRDAFAFPNRKTCSDLTNTDGWKQFPLLLESQQRQKIAFVTDLYPPRECGGVAVFMKQLAEKLAACGHEITVITYSDNDNPTVDLENGVWVHRIVIDNHTSINNNIMPHSLAINADAVAKEIERINEIRQFNWIVGSIWDMNLASVIQLSKYKVAMYLVTSYALMIDSKPEWKANTEYYEKHVLKMIEAEKWGLENADLILASTSAIRNDMNNAYGNIPALNKAAIQPFGINPGNHDLITVKNDNKLTLLYVGRFEKRKGIEDLLSCIPHILENNPQVYFRLVGNNTIIDTETGKTYWENFAEQHQEKPWFSRIHLCGIVSDDDLEKEYAQTDLFIAPSRYESFGLIFLEAMKYGKACIGCMSGGIPEVVIHNETGLLPPSCNPSELQKSIQYLIDNPNIRNAMGQKGLQRFNDYFTIDKFAEGFLNKLNSVN